MSKPMSIHLPEELARQLDSIAKESGRSRSEIVQEALECYIEDWTDLHIAQNRLHDKTDPIVSGKHILQLRGRVK